MTADLLRHIFDTLYLLALGAWAGATVLVLLVFRDSSTDSRSATETLLLGRFYALGATCGALALPAALCTRLAFPEYRTPWFALQALTLIALTLPMFAGAARLSPRGRSIPPSPLRAIRIRFAVLLTTLAALAAFQALRPPPRTRGILEPPPRALQSPHLPTSAGEMPRSGIH